MFTRQHYKAIAEVVYQNAIAMPIAEIPNDPCIAARVEGIHDAGKWIALALADYFAEDNERFDRSKFLEACKIKED